MITVVVPVYNNIKITDDFFMSILGNTILPEKIILIDNGSQDKYYKLIEKYNKLNIDYIRKETNEGVNSAWNIGISLAKTPYISILNNDLILNKYFFQMIIKSLSSDSTIGIVVPFTTRNKDYINRTRNEDPKLENLIKREGWAFTIKKEITDKIDPIPSNLEIYYGDDYLFYYTQQLNYKSMKMINNFVFHYGQRTIKTLNFNPDEKLNQEKKFWKLVPGIKLPKVIPNSNLPINEKVLSREKTLEYLLKKYENKERIILTRYNDGENLLMHGLEKGNVKRLIGDGSSKILKDLMLNAIKDKRQFICTNYLKAKNTSEYDPWYKIQRYFVELGGQELYGCSHWTVYDFCNENKLLPYLFSRNTLVVSGICEYFEPIIKKYNKNIYCYSTPNISAEKSYEKIKLDLIKLSKNFQNIVLCCGPLSKVLVVDLIDHCDAHLVDLGSITNAICCKDEMWTMSWTKTVNLQLLSNNFLLKLKEIQ